MLCAPATSSKTRNLTFWRSGHFYKAAKVDADGDVKTNGHATVEDEEEDENEYAGPAMPEDDVPDDDEEGRFFGGGVNKDTAEVLDFIDQRDAEDAGVSPNAVAPCP